MKIAFDRRVTKNLEQALRLEWLETNGLGGWASSTLPGLNTRKYHGVLVAATHPPLGRVVLLSKLDETIVSHGKRYDLGCNQYPEVVEPEGYRYLERFTHDVFPTFEYRAGGVILTKTVAAIHGENTTAIVYRVVRAPGLIELVLQPFVAARAIHAVQKSRPDIRPAMVRSGLLTAQPFDDQPPVHILVPGAGFEARPYWYYNFDYAADRERGFDHREDLYRYGVFRKTLKKGDTLGVIVSAENPAGRDASELLAAERERRHARVELYGRQPDAIRALVRAADQLVVQRGRDLNSIIAGYPWLSDWGRDAMIALPGLCLCTGRFDEARRILRSFAQQVREGLVPHRFPESGDPPEYGTVDATLWFFNASWKYWEYTADDLFVREELYPLLADIVRWHDRGTRHGIHTDADGLLWAGEPGRALTWMDAQTGDAVVTPRIGKAVEVNALWHNALALLARLADHFHREDDATLYRQRAEKVRQAFDATFWNEGTGCLLDVVDGDRIDTSIRVNQLFALSLPFAPMDGERARKVLAMVERHLFTPFGVRTLAPSDPNYHGLYRGTQVERDAARHCGAAWPGLLGPYIDAVVRLRGRSDARRVERQILNTLRQHLADAGLGSVSQVCDGDAPHRPGGCVAHAWCTGELLRAWFENLATDRRSLRMRHARLRRTQADG